MLISIPFSSNKDCTCWNELVKVVPTNSAYDLNEVELLILSWICRLVLGPCIKITSLAIGIISEIKETLYAIGSATLVTTQHVDFITNCSGKASYNLIRISVPSNCELVAMTILLSPKLR